MKKIYKKIIFTAVGVAVIVSGLMLIRAANNRGDSPFIFLKFDEGQGTTAEDSTGNNNRGTITGATWANEDDCVTGKCLYFDGSGDYLEIGDFDL